MILGNRGHVKNRGVTLRLFRPLSAIYDNRIHSLVYKVNLALLGKY